jgi:hypothetical protein
MNKIPQGTESFQLHGFFSPYMLKHIVPKSVTILKLGRLTYGSLKKGDIHDGVIYLTISSDTDNVIEEGAIPNSVRTLKFGLDFESKLDKVIPHGVTHLIISGDYPHDIKNTVPCSITHLTFISSFRLDPSKSIPDNVAHLTFDSHYDPRVYADISNGVTN